MHNSDVIKNVKPFANNQPFPDFFLTAAPNQMRGMIGLFIFN